MSGLAPPPGRQGPGRVPAALVDTLDLTLVRRAGGALPGEHRAAGAGVGTELARLRPYEPGDDVRRLDPAASARTGEPHVRLEVPERVLVTWLLLDRSPSMAFGTADRLKSDVADGVTELVGRLAVRRGGSVALLTHGASVRRFLPPRSGRGAAVALGRILAEGVATDGHRDPGALADALRRVGRMARSPGLVVAVSDFRGLDRWRRPLGALRARHAVLAVEVRDPREAELAAVGRIALVDPESGRLIRADTGQSRLRERYAAAERCRRAEVAAELRRAGARHVIVSTDGEWAKELGRTLG